MLIKSNRFLLKIVSNLLAISSPLAISYTDSANSAAICSLNSCTKKQIYVAYVIIRGVHWVIVFCAKRNCPFILKNWNFLVVYTLYQNGEKQEKTIMAVRRASHSGSWYSDSGWVNTWLLALLVFIVLFQMGP